MTYLRLNILNQTAFLEMLRSCTGPVFLVSPQGKTLDIHRWPELLEAFWRSSPPLSPLSLKIVEPRDHIKITHYCIGDC